MKPNYKLCLSASCADKRPRPLRDLGYKDTIKVIFSFSGISYFKIGPRRDRTCLRSFRQSEIKTSLLAYRD